mgnify:CR=1 FL=1
MANKQIKLAYPFIVSFLVAGGRKKPQRLVSSIGGHVRAEGYLLSVICVTLNTVAHCRVKSL